MSGVEGGAMRGCEAEPVGRVMEKDRVVLPGDARTLSWEKVTVPFTALATLPERDWFPVVPANKVIEFASMP